MDKMNQHDQVPVESYTKEIRKTKQERANAKRKFTRESIGFMKMITDGRLPSHSTERKI